MILEAVLSIIVDFVCYSFAFVGDLSFTINYGIFESVMDYIYMAAWLFPIGDLLPIVFLIIVVNNLQIVISFIKFLINLLPFF